LRARDMTKKFFSDTLLNKTNITDKPPVTMIVSLYVIGNRKELFSVVFLGKILDTNS